MNLNSSPIIVGGNGGSGTRVVAEILIRSGVYMGRDLNESKDDLSFTYFFKRPRRFRHNIGRPDSRLAHLFKLHKRVLLGYLPNTALALGLVLEAGWDHAVGRYNWIWVLERWWRMLHATPILGPTFWGWKEPNTMLFLRGIRSAYPTAKFILVLRNGLDMAYSKNRQQLENWGSCFQLDPKDLRPQNRFEYWYRSNLRARATLEELFADRFAIVKLEDLCLQTEPTLDRLFELIGLDRNQVPQDVWTVPRLPDSHGRHHRFDLAWIDSDVRGKLAEMGYEKPNRGS